MWETNRFSGRVIDESGDPVFNATVAVNGSSRKTTTASDGHYKMGIEAGTKEIVISADDYQRETATLNVSSGEWTSLDVTLSFRPTRVVGTVTATNGTALENATVTVVGTGNETRTDHNGTYELDLDAGTHVLEASADGHDDWQTVVSIPEHRTVEQNFTLTASGGDEGDETDGTNESDDGSETNESDDESNREPGNETDESAPGNESGAASSDETESRSESNVATSDSLSIREQVHYLLLLACLFLAVLVTTTVAGLYWNRTYDP